MQVENLRQLISRRLGVRVRDQDLPGFRDTLVARYSQLHLRSLEEYVTLLQRTTAESDDEWQLLATLLTTGETFFFRDAGQIELLRNHILPGLIDSRRETKSLRIWSAGCSSGEEPYSIAILLDELIGGRNDWRVSVLGTDIDTVALDKARAGVFTPWSFRKVQPSVQRKYFHESGRDWEIDQNLKNEVTFKTLNLLTENFPNAVAQEMDLIICRNVFIYFDSEHVAAILKKFSATLRNGGYLVTGHGELQGQNLAPLQTRVFLNSVVYQRIDIKNTGKPAEKQFVSISPSGVLPQKLASRELSDRTAQPASPLPTRQAASSHSPVDDEIDEIETLRRRGDHSLALAKAKQMVNQHPRSARAHCLLAQSYADVGNHVKAIESLGHATAIDSFDSAPHYLLGHIAEAEGRTEEAKSCFKKVIYLDPAHIAAHLELAAILERDGKADQARKMWQVVIDLLKAMPDDEPIEFHGSTSAGQMVDHLQQKVKNG